MTEIDGPTWRDERVRISDIWRDEETRWLVLTFILVHALAAFAVFCWVVL
jgi:hypothetical protein